MFIFKRAIKKNISADEAEEILQKLNSFLDENSPQLTYWLAKIFNDQQNSITYTELEKAAAAGFENEIHKWQEEYAKFVNEKLNPLLILSIHQGAKHFSEKHKNIFYDNDRFVKDWLNKHAAEFITNINAETRQAIKFILAYGQDNGMSVKELAKIIRPTIGLNQRQAAANLNYRNSVKEKLLQNNPRMSQAKAEQKAQAAALKYASKQHRQRAEMIAHTELAFAYNRGAHESVRQAMSNGLMGRCEKVWTTAGTNRVCGRCMDLSGTVVGFEDKFFNSSVTDGQTPPLHPRCRCVIVYREIDSPKFPSGRMFVNIEHQPPYILGKLPDLKESTVNGALNYFENQIVNASVENAVILTAAGDIYHCTGNLHEIPLNFFEEMSEKLRGATMTHNHPIGAEENAYTFSDDDEKIFKNFKLARLRGIDEKYIYELNRNPEDIDFKEITAEKLDALNKTSDDYHLAVVLWALGNKFGYRRWQR